MEWVRALANDGLLVGEKYELGDKIRGPPPFYTKNDLFHLIKSQPVALQKKC